MTTTSPVDPWSPAQRLLVDAQDRRDHAQVALEQLVRDLVGSGRLSVSDAARALAGRPDMTAPPRQRVQAILGRGPDGVAPRPPRVPALVYLRGMGVKDDGWTRVQEAMWARGWWTVRDRTAAWHAARSGMADVVMVDFSSTDGELTRQDAVVATVRARYDDEGGTELARVLGGQIPRPERPKGDGGGIDAQVLAREVGRLLGNLG
ncbi:hypothetical protein [Luteimicrobium sp. DT211]|uniref:hypothetical protein n=1 Tax=Luteimicrobium sp. DT211 TaxID=3393412 RepID=UPI003CF9B1A3